MMHTHFRDFNGPLYSHRKNDIARGGAIHIDMTHIDWFISKRDVLNHIDMIHIHCTWSLSTLPHGSSGKGTKGKRLIRWIEVIVVVKRPSFDVDMNQSMWIRWPVVDMNYIDSIVNMNDIVICRWDYTSCSNGNFSMWMHPTISTLFVTVKTRVSH